jgi:hypothetical protein
LHHQLWLRGAGLVDDPAARHVFRLEAPGRAVGEDQGAGGVPRVTSPMPGKVRTMMTKNIENAEEDLIQYQGFLFT